jgi:ribosomal protein S18 acetylase RimI-like enzyme
LGYAITWHEGPRSELRGLFELADDSGEQLDAYIDLGRVLVAADDLGEIVGHLQLIATGESGVLEIKNVAVSEDHQGRGIGRSLVERAVEVSRAEGATALTVITAMADIGNLRFYQRCGFRATAIDSDAFTPETGYPADLTADGIPVRDAIRFSMSLGVDRAVS